MPAKLLQAASEGDAALVAQMLLPFSNTHFNANSESERRYYFFPPYCLRSNY